MNGLQSSMEGGWFQVKIVVSSVGWDGAHVLVVGDEVPQLCNGEEGREIRDARSELLTSREGKSTSQLRLVDRI